MIQDDIYPDDWIEVYHSINHAHWLHYEAWYSPSRRLVEFSGMWINLPPWKVDHCPTREEVYQYATGE